MIALILTVGGLTRLNQAGLSIIEWEVVKGVIPPLNHTEWEAVFETYRQYPEYQKVHRGMTLSEFKVIYWWEYSHRMLSRMLGLLFIIPFIWFSVKRVMPAGDAVKLSGIVFLGGIQAFLGWYMVQSGLDSQPVVSHLRLGIHLTVAFLLFALIWTMALNRIPGSLKVNEKVRCNRRSRNIIRWMVWVGFLALFLQVLVGGWTAGLRAGFVYPTFPKMGEFWIPPQLAMFNPLWYDLTHNAVSVQFIHRLLGLLLTIFVLVPVVAGFRSGNRALQYNGVGLLVIITVQITTGALNLLWGVPVWLAVLHQLGALILLAALLTWLNLFSRMKGDG